MDGRDHEEWRDDPLVLALRAPGTEAELAGEDEYLAAFRASRPHGGSVHRLAGRIGLGATTAVAAVVLTTGVAAAYTQVLPDPVQRIVHQVLGPVGVPAPPHRHPAAAPQPKVVPPTPDATAPPASPSGASTPHRPTGTSSAPTGTPTPGPLPTPAPALPVPPVTGPTVVPAPSATTSPRPVHRIPAALSVSASSGRALVGSTVVVTGTVSDDQGRPLGRRTVRLLASTQHGSWSVVSTTRSDRSGRVTLRLPQLTESTRLQLRTDHQVRSTAVTVVAMPVVTAAVSEASGTSTLGVTVHGGQPGDQVVLLVRRDGRLVRIGSARLDANLQAVLTRATPKRPTRLVVRVLGSARHASAQAGATVGSSS